MSDITVIITAYKTAQYLEECIASIPKSYNIILGVDGCLSTYSKALQLKKKYIFRLFYSDRNIGTYLLRNSLALKSKTSHLIFFDSDDIMKANFESNYKPIKGVARFQCLNFSQYGKSDKPILGEGVFGIDKELFVEIGGFKPWKCSADSDFRLRYRRNNLSEKVINKVLFQRRQHYGSLTNNKPTRVGSRIRIEYSEQMQKCKLKSIDYEISDITEILN